MISCTHAFYGWCQRSITVQKKVLVSWLQKCINTAEGELWKAVDEMMSSRHDDTVNKLSEMGLSEGNPDDESDEGQIWQMIEGRLPYTLDMVWILACNP